MINTGFIMLQRDLINWEWYTDINSCKLFLHCLLKVNYSQKKWQGNVINKGEFITSYEKLAVETGLSVSKVRTALSKLIDSKYIIVTTSTIHTKISIPTLRDFVVDNNRLPNDNPLDKQTSKQLTSESQTNHKQIATTNTNNNLLKNRKKIFREKVFELSNFKSKDLDSFFNYWTELNKDKTEMRFEKQNFFEIEKRIEKWVKNEKVNGLVSQPQKKLLTNR
jgi:hypothetical protein